MLYYRYMNLLKSKNKQNEQLKTVDDYITDKFSTLWCCKDFFNKYTADWNISMLVEMPLGKRYFSRFESLDKELTKICSDLLVNSTCFTEGDNGNVSHFGIILTENEPYCKSKFSKDYSGTPCVDAVCNHPNLTVYDKYLGALM